MFSQGKINFRSFTHSMSKTLISFSKTAFSLMVPRTDNGEFKTVLGEWNYKRNVIIKFPSYEIAMEWYNSEEYAPIKKIREDNSEGNIIMIEGL